MTLRADGTATEHARFTQMLGAYITHTSRPYLHPKSDRYRVHYDVEMADVKKEGNHSGKPSAN